MNNGEQPNIVPFGKYKGQPLEVLANDQGYLDWLNGQGWVKDKYPQFYTVIINNFQEPSDTPEHNALQAMFLDDDLCMRLLNAMNMYLDKDLLLKEFYGQRFEANGADVRILYDHWCLDSGGNWFSMRSCCDIEIKPSIGDDFPSVLRQAQRMDVNTRSYLDYHRCVVFRDFVATSVSLEKVKQMFRHSNVFLFSLDEVQEWPIRLFPDEKSLDD